MKKYLIISVIALILLSTGEIFAQHTQKQAGFRFGGTTGFTGRIITANDFAYEMIVGFRSGGAQLYLLFEARRPVFYRKLENIYFYYGGGVHGGYVRWNDSRNALDPAYYPDYRFDNRYRYSGPAVGIDGVAGLECNFKSIPVSLGVEFKPFAEMYGPYLFRINFWDFGFHIRYNF
ncbi:MAG: hypothetical protein K0B08_05225 [Bacteroidales bacterium]|nr:hypothetical protein [Bacteroidales bacterium]